MLRCLCTKQVGHKVVAPALYFLSAGCGTGAGATCQHVPHYLQCYGFNRLGRQPFATITHGKVVAQLVGYKLSIVAN